MTVCLCSFCAILCIDGPADRVDLQQLSSRQRNLPESLSSVLTVQLNNLLWLYHEDILTVIPIPNLM